MMVSDVPAAKYSPLELTCIQMKSACRALLNSTTLKPSFLEDKAGDSHIINLSADKDTILLRFDSGTYLTCKVLKNGIFM